MAWTWLRGVSLSYSSMLHRDPLSSALVLVLLVSPVDERSYLSRASFGPTFPFQRDALHKSESDYQIAAPKWVKSKVAVENSGGIRGPKGLRDHQGSQRVRDGGGDVLPLTSLKPQNFSSNDRKVPEVDILSPASTSRAAAEVLQPAARQACPPQVCQDEERAIV